MEFVGRLSNGVMTCFAVGGHSILLCERKEPLARTTEQDNKLHHAFDVSPEMFNKACKVFHEMGDKDSGAGRLPAERFLHRSATVCPRPERQSDRAP
jgi:hypothetical protein